MQSQDLTFTDTHCHVFVQEFDEDRADVIARAIAMGVHRIMLPNIDLESIDRMMAVCGQFPGVCFPMLGLHPCSVKPDFASSLEQIENTFDQYDFVGIGETGVDLYWDTTHRNEQIEVFEQHLAWGKRYDLPVIIHSRESLDLNIELVRKHQDGSLRGIFHCFGGTVAQALEIAELGFKIGIGGIITYKKATLPEVLRQVPASLIVLETDSPYLSPVPFRGKRNEPAYLSHVIDGVALALQSDRAFVSRLTEENARQVFEKKVKFAGPGTNEGR